MKPVQFTVVPFVAQSAHASDTGISIAHPTPSAITEQLLSKNFRTTNPSNDRARIRLARIALRGGRYPRLRFLSLTGAELAPRPHWTGPKSARLSVDHCFCATGIGADRSD
jgi:hypothetical protein